MRKRFSFDDEEHALSLIAWKYSLDFLANEGWHLLRCNDNLEGFIDSFVSWVKQMRHCGNNGLFWLAINPY